jgi:hypothetical protein
MMEQLNIVAVQERKIMIINIIIKAFILFVFIIIYYYIKWKQEMFIYFG